MVANAVKRIGEFIINYKFSILLFAYLCVITVMPCNYFSKPSIVNVLSFFLIINIIAKTRWSFIFTIILSYLLTFDAYFAFSYGLRAPVGLMASIFETNSSEALSMAKDFLPLALGLFAITTLLVYLTQREWKAVRLSRKASLISLLVYWIIFIPAILYWKGIRLPKDGEESSTPFSIVVQANISEHFPLIYGDIATIIAYKKELRKLKKYQNTVRVVPKDLIMTDSLNAPNKIFLIVGESSYRDHYSLYGYPVPTTPFLDSLSHVNDTPLSYYDGLSSSAITREALRISLSFSTPSDFTPFFTETNIIDLANRNGYETVWISNHDLVGLFDSYIGFISSNAQRSFYEKTVERKDINLIPAIRDMYDAEKKQFFVIHLIGSHMQYRDRHDQKDENAIGNDASKTVSYDRSIHHTDRVLREITNIALRDSSSLVYYASDHGEIIGKGHGFLKQSVAQFQIPLLTINNSAVPIDSIVNKYIDPTNKLINSNSTIYILSEVLGYSVPEKDISKAIEDGRYIFHTDEKVYRYDDLLRENP